MTATSPPPAAAPPAATDTFVLLPETPLRI
ncbi:MAG: hypothetical protein QOK01_1634 [Alphaproteobacteria bacterium]|nr:hypothetical protein [Alphaproteobacteria bacterium]